MHAEENMKTGKLMCDIPPKIKSNKNWYTGYYWHMYMWLKSGILEKKKNIADSFKAIKILLTKTVNMQIVKICWGSHHTS